MTTGPEHDHTTARERRVSLWLLEPRGRTGTYLGDGVLTSTDFVVLYPGTARAALAAGPPPRVRVAVETPWARYVTDGTTMKPGEDAPASLLAVELDWPIAEEPDPMPVDPRSGDVDELMEWLEKAERLAPHDEPTPPARTGYTRKPRPVRRGARDGKPWWCQVWPGCWGCE